MYDPIRTYVKKSHYEHGKWFEGMRLEIHQDDNPTDPREWCNLGHMVCAHKRYELGDEQLDTSDYSSWDEIEEMLEKERGAVIILPLYLFDHSGLSMSTSSSLFRACDHMAWDWGQVGFIYVTFDVMQKEYGDTMPASMEKAERVLVGEVEEYDKYLRGDVYGYKLYTDVDEDGEDGNEIDSCWDFYDINSILEDTGFTEGDEV